MKLMDVNIVDFANDVTRGAVDGENRKFELLDMASCEDEVNGSTIYFADVCVRVKEDDGTFWQHDRLELEINTKDQVYRLISHPQRGYQLTKKILCESKDFDIVNNWMHENIQTYKI